MGLFTNSIKPASGLGSGFSGGIIQIKYTPVRGVVSHSSNETGIHTSAFDTTITPTSTNSRMFITVYFGAVSSSGGNTNGWMIRRGSSTEVDELRANSDGNRRRYACRGATTWNTDQNHCHSYAFTVIDHPSTTSSVTYRLYTANEGSHTVYFNRGRNNTNSGSPIYARTMSSMTVMEVTR
tara:strand:- start:109 stop:651 length:543 start_codon:yes stop_codon:yes gene_type:complete